MDEQRLAAPTTKTHGLSCTNAEPSYPKRLSSTKKKSAPVMHVSIHNEVTQFNPPSTRLTQSMHGGSSGSCSAASTSLDDNADASSNAASDVDSTKLQQKKKSTENLMKSFKFLKRVSTDIAIWKSRSSMRPHNGACRQSSSSADSASSIRRFTPSCRHDPHNDVACCRTLTPVHGASCYIPSQRITAPATAPVCSITRSPGACNTIAPRYKKCLAEHKPTPADIRVWGSSFQALLDHACGLAMFREFLRSEFSDENLDFWVACKIYHQSSNESSDLLRDNANNLFEQFLKDQALKEVNLDSETRQITVSRLEADSVDLNTFTEAQQRIYTLMEKDSYRRFIQSDAYRQVIEQYCQKLTKEHAVDANLFC